jgi:CRP-like cAMP-binding protein
VGGPVREFGVGGVVFKAGGPTVGVWIVRDGSVELFVGSGRRRAVVHLLRPGDVDGDIQMLLGRNLSYTGRALSGVTCLFLGRDDFEKLLATGLPLARRWLPSVAQRLAASQTRVLGLLGGSLTAQAARLLTGEADGGRVEPPQRTLAAMLGARLAVAEPGAQGSGTGRPDRDRLCGDRDPGPGRAGPARSLTAALSATRQLPTGAPPLMAGCACVFTTTGWG